MKEWNVRPAYDVQDFIDSLSDEEQREVKTFTESLEELGPRMTETSWATRISGGGGLCELRPRCRTVRIRLYYCQSGEREFTTVLGHKKKGKREQQNAINEAKRRMNRLKED